MNIVLATVTDKFIERLRFIEQFTSELYSQQIYSILQHDNGLRSGDAVVIGNCELYMHKVLCMSFDLFTYDGIKAFHFEMLPCQEFEQYFSNTVSTYIKL